MATATIEPPAFCSIGLDMKINLWNHNGELEALATRTYIAASW